MNTQDNVENKHLSIGEAADYLGISIDTLRRWEKRGRINPYRSPGGHRYYDTQDLDNLFNKKYSRDEATTGVTVNPGENTIQTEAENINQSDVITANSPQNEVEQVINPPSIPDILPPESYNTTELPLSEPEAQQAGGQTEPQEVKTINPEVITNKEVSTTTSILEPVKPENISLRPDTEARINNILNYETVNSKLAKKRDHSITLIIAIAAFTLLDLFLFFLWYSSTKIVIPIP